MNPNIMDLSREKPRPVAVNAIENPCVKGLTEYYFNKDLYKNTNDIYNKNNSIIKVGTFAVNVCIQYVN